MPACDLAIFAAVVHTMADGGAAASSPAPAATAVAVRDGRIAAVGSRADIDALVGPSTRVLDLEAAGACVTPGLVDAHIHPLLGLDLARGAELSTVASHDELHAALRAEAGRTGEGWVIGWGLDPSFVRGRNLAAADLEPAVAERPVFVRLFDGHSAVVNRAALALAGIDGAREFESSARIDVDAAGAPTGFLIEWQAMALVQAVMPPVPLDERVAGLRELLAGMADAGLTGGQVLDDAPGFTDVLRAAEALGPLPIRLTVSPWVQAGDAAEQLDRVIALQGERGERWRVDGVKLMIDGTIDNGSAWLEYPDVNGESTGPLWLDPASYTAVLERLHGEGIRTTTHAIGDAGIRHTAESIARVQREQPEPVPGLPTPRHRIEHLETLPDATLRTIADAGIAASMQPTHCTLYCAADGSDNWSRRLGDERARRAWRIGSLRRAGVTMALGSDWPIAPYEPLRIMADAQLRRRAGRPGDDAVLPAEAISASDALAGYTSARADSWQAETGRIAVGLPADLSVFGADVLATAPDALPDVPVLGTIVGGEWREVGGAG